MHAYHSTREVPRNHEYGFWREVIGSAYFNLQLQFPDSGPFDAQLEAWDLGLLSLSRLDSSALSYKRLRQHCQQDQAEILVTIPLTSEVAFSQMGRDIRCSPGQFILEHGNEPYEFSHAQHSTKWVLKVPEAALAARIGSTSRFCALHFDITQGVGRLFGDYLNLIIKHCDHYRDSAVLELMGTQLVELLCAALKENPNVLQSSHSVVRNAHLARIEAFVRQFLFDGTLDPERIATACGISVRYLHDLFKDVGQPVTQWVRELRLQAAHEQLTRSGSVQSIAQVAYANGFTDQAQFSHAFKRKFGISPSEVRAQK